MNKKHYEIPESELLLVNFEENIMSPNGYNEGGGGSYGDEDSNDNGDY